MLIMCVCVFFQTWTTQELPTWPLMILIVMVARCGRSLWPIRSVRSWRASGGNSNTSSWTRVRSTELEAGSRGSWCCRSSRSQSLPSRSTEETSISMFTSLAVMFRLENFILIILKCSWSCVCDHILSWCLLAWVIRWWWRLRRRTWWPSSTCSWKTSPITTLKPMLSTRSMRSTHTWATLYSRSLSPSLPDTPSLYSSSLSVIHALKSPMGLSGISDQ